jgi:hypothetical protein
VVDAGPPPEEVVVLRPTRAQRVVGALARASCAAPLLLGAFLGGGMVTTALLTTFIAGSIVFVLDLAARADQEVQLRADSLVARGRSYPWWAIDQLEVRDRAGRRSIVLSAFGMPGFVLEAPRSSAVVAHRGFDREATMLLDAWERLRTPTRSVIDLRDAPPEPAEAEPTSPTAAEG